MHILYTHDRKTKVNHYNILYFYFILFLSITYFIFLLLYRHNTLISRELKLFKKKFYVPFSYRSYYYFSFLCLFTRNNDYYTP